MDLYSPHYHLKVAVRYVVEDLEGMRREFARDIRSNMSDEFFILFNLANVKMNHLRSGHIYVVNIYDIGHYGLAKMCRSIKLSVDKHLESDRDKEFERCALDRPSKIQWIHDHIDDEDNEVLDMVCNAILKVEDITTSEVSEILDYIDPPASVIKHVDESSSSD